MTEYLLAKTEEYPRIYPNFKIIKNLIKDERGFLVVTEEMDFFCNTSASTYQRTLKS